MSNRSPQTFSKDIFPVYLVGAGSGDPELLTLKAARILREECDVVVYDRLVGEGVMALIAPNAERIYAGKSAKCHTMTQDEINEALVHHARQGKKVVRLKGGDPLLYGRGSEEALFLIKHAIPFEIIPGIMAVNAMAATFAVPLTHRGIASSVRIITGHMKEGVPEFSDWNGLNDPQTTLVIYMGLSHIDLIADKLISAGVPADMSVMIASDVSLATQKHLKTSIKKMAIDVKNADIKAPALVIIGKVVDIASQLRPL